MPSAREDYVLRMIREAVQAVARLAGLRREGRFATAREDIVRVKALIAGDAGPVLDRLDPATTVHLMGDPRRTLVYAQILAEEAALERVAGGEARAGWAAGRALAIVEILAALPEPPVGVGELLAELRGREPTR